MRTSNPLEYNAAQSRIKAAQAAGESAKAEDLAIKAIQKAYGVTQYSDTMNLNGFARHIATHGCVYSRADIAAILTMAVDCLREQLLAGTKVQLGDLGSFSLSMNCVGADSAEKFNSKVNVKRLNVIWERGPLFENLLEEAEFNLVASRSAQAAVLKALKAGESTVNLNGEDDETASPDGTGGSDSGQQGGQTPPSGGGSNPGGAGGGSDYI